MKKKYYLTLDTETATLPCSSEICKTANERQTVAIAKPLVYDIGWIIMDRAGNIVKTANYLVQETFFVPSVFNTAYYRDKRPLYLSMLDDGRIMTANWNEIVDVLLADLRTVDIVSAYNAAFDFKKAIPFTEQYIKHLYSVDFPEWEAEQREKCAALVRKPKPASRTSKNSDYMEPFFELRNERFPFADLWGITCNRLINIDKYRDYCLKNSLLTSSTKFFKSSAETAFQYLMRQYDFSEAHTALSDAIIESQILAKALKKGKVEAYFEAFPFRNLGTTFDYVTEKRPKYKKTVIDALRAYIEANNGEARVGHSSYWTQMVQTLETLEEEND